MHMADAFVSVFLRFWGGCPTALEQLFVTGTYPEKRQGRIYSICIRHLSSLAPLQMSHWINGFFQVGATEWEKETLLNRNHHRLQTLKSSLREKGWLDNKLSVTCPLAHLCQLSRSKDSSSSPDQTYSLSRDAQSPSPSLLCGPCLNETGPGEMSFVWLIWTPSITFPGNA